MSKNIEIGSLYEEVRSKLIEKIRDPDNIEVRLEKSTSEGHACYFCGERIPEGFEMFVVKYYERDSLGNLGPTRYFADEKCVSKIRKR